MGVCSVVPRAVCIKAGVHEETRAVNLRIMYQACPDNVMEVFNGNRARNAEWC